MTEFAAIVVCLGFPSEIFWAIVCGISVDVRGFKIIFRYPMKSETDKPTRARRPSSSIVVPRLDY